MAFCRLGPKKLWDVPRKYNPQYGIHVCITSGPAIWSTMYLSLDFRFLWRRKLDITRGK
ncbi:hypothetical protein M433DRAFT_327808 [Acidomyces richmondensis BFW]|nr:MAG: hypothetical protein FE78DRAFT_505317 [Acidomyces sp. 'richmondensis']KYG49288.1 hypothetical protein M433DRAFT_327808 [Acidomyces richmondensis BFW]